MKFTIIIFTASLAIGVSALTFLNYSFETEAAQETSAVSEVVEEEIEEPFLTVALHSAQRVEDDIQFLMSKSGMRRDDAKSVHEMMSEFLDYVQAIEQTKPIAFLSYLGENGPEDGDTLFCFPVTDIKRFTRMLKKHGKVNECALGFVYKPFDGEKKLIRHEGDYVYISTERERLKNLPPNVESSTFELLGSNSAAAKLAVRTLPDELRQKALDSIDDDPINFMGLEESEYVTAFTSWIQNYVQDTEEIVIGFNIDREQNRIALESRLLATEGSPTAKDSADNMALNPTQFSGFHQNNNSMVRLRMHSGPICDCIKGLKNDAKKSFALLNGDLQTSPETDSFVEPLERMFDQTMAEGNFEIATNLSFEDGNECLLIAIHVHDTKPFDDLVQSIVEKSDMESKEAFAKFGGVQRHGNITLFSFVDDKYDAFKELFPIELSNHRTMAYDDHAFYFAHGKNGAERLKECINNSNSDSDQNDLDNSNQDTYLSSIEFNATPFVENWLDPLFKTGLQSSMNLEIKSRYAKFLKEEGDAIALKYKPIENGFEYQVSVDIGFAKTCLNIIETVGEPSDEEFNRITANRRKQTHQRRVNTNSDENRKSRENATTMDDDAQLAFQKGFNRGLKDSIEKQKQSQQRVKMTDQTGSRISNPFVE